MTATADPPAPRRPGTPRRSKSLFTPEILWPAIGASFKKLDPRVQVRNPVMFVVEVGARHHHDRRGSLGGERATRAGSRSRSRSGCG